MKDAGAKKRLVKAFREEGGFTLPEMMVTIVIMIVVLFALYSIFDMSLRVFAFGNDKAEATGNARVALERMEREIRGAYPRNPPTDESRLDPAASDGDQITFWNKFDKNSDGVADIVKISFYVDNGNLMRQQDSDDPESLTELGPGGSLEFKYFDKTSGAEITTPSTTNEKDIGMVRIKLVVVEDGTNQDLSQELITNAALRNRGI